MTIWITTSMSSPSDSTGGPLAAGASCSTAWFSRPCKWPRSHTTPSLSGRDPDSPAYRRWLSQRHTPIFLLGNDELSGVRALSVAPTRDKKNSQNQRASRNRSHSRLPATHRDDSPYGRTWRSHRAATRTNESLIIHQLQMNRSAPTAKNPGRLPPQVMGFMLDGVLLVRLSYGLPCSVVPRAVSLSQSVTPGWPSANRLRWIDIGNFLANSKN
jgi:hypothetical protein